MKKLIIAVLSLVVISCGSGNEKKAQTNVELLSVEQFRQVITDHGVMIIDVRTAHEYETGFIDRAVNIDIKSPDFKKRLDHFDKNLPIAVYCQRGKRSAMASEQLKELGFRQIYDLKGCYKAWDQE